MAGSRDAQRPALDADAVRGRTLTDADIDAIAAAVARQLVEAVERPVFRLLTVQELARELNVTTAFIYRHKVALGAMPLGDGRSPQLRFELGRAMKALEQWRAAAYAPRGRPRTR